MNNKGATVAFLLFVLITLYVGYQVIYKPISNYIVTHANSPTSTSTIASASPGQTQDDMAKEQRDRETRLRTNNQSDQSAFKPFDPNAPYPTDPVEVVRAFMSILWTKLPENINYKAREYCSNQLLGDPSVYIDEIMDEYNKSGVQPPTKFVGGTGSGQSYPAEVSVYITFVNSAQIRLFMVAKGHSYDMEKLDQDGNLPYNAGIGLCACAFDKENPGYQNTKAILLNRDIHILEKNAGFIGPTINGWIKVNGRWEVVSILSGTSNRDWVRFLEVYGLKKGDTFHLEERTVPTVRQRRISFGLDNRDGDRWRIANIHMEELIDL